MLKATNLKKNYGSKEAVKSISLEIRKGQILGLLGPNGAGKSTTIKMLSGQIEPTDAQFEIDSTNHKTIPKQFKDKIGVMPQDIILWEFLNVRENIEYQAKLHRLSSQEAKKQTDFLMNALSLHKEEKTLSQNLSGGYKRRLNLAISIVHNPEYIFLDEPTPGIDAQSRRFLYDYIMELKKDHAIVLTDHYLEEAERLSDYVVIIDDGEIITEGTVPELKKKHGEGNYISGEIDDSNLSLEKQVNESSIQEKIKNFQKELEKSFEQVRFEGTKFGFLTQNDKDAVSKINSLEENLNIHIKTISIKEPTLEDIFIILTGKEIRE